MFQPQPEKELFLSRAGLEAPELPQSMPPASQIRAYQERLKKGARQFSALDQAGKQAKNIKWKAIEQLDKQLERFEEKFVERGGKVFWAENAEEALAFVSSICEEKEAQTIVKSKSSVAEEINLAGHLRGKGLQVVETDLGDYLMQLNSERPVHMVNSAYHKSTQEIAQILREQFKAKSDLPLEGLVRQANEQIRSRYRSADVGITGSNFLIAEEGAVALTGNEGNIRLTTAFPQTHIVLAGIEKVLPSLNDLALFWPLLATYADGKTIAPYNSIIYGPRKAGETDGPNDMYVILIDNGRTELLRPETRSALYCVRCGACLNTCPVYQQIGGHAYNTVYNGPIGSVITPHMSDMHAHGYLSFAAPASGAGAEVCPVHIDLPSLLLENRHIYVAEGYGSIKEKIAWRLFKRGMLHRSVLNTASGKIKTFLFEKLFGKAWGAHRSPLIFPDKTFNQQWKKRHPRTGSDRHNRS